MWSVRRLAAGPASTTLLWYMPVVNVVLGSVAGAPAVIAADGHFNVMVKGTSQLFVGGPPVVKASRGLEISKEELGGEDVHVYGNGVVQNLADSEAEAMAAGAPLPQLSAPERLGDAAA